LLAGKEGRKRRSKTRIEIEREKNWTFRLKAAGDATVSEFEKATLGKADFLGSKEGPLVSHSKGIT